MHSKKFRVCTRSVNESSKGYAFVLTNELWTVMERLYLDYTIDVQALVLEKLFNLSAKKIKEASDRRKAAFASGELKDDLVGSTSHFICIPESEEDNQVMVDCLLSLKLSFDTICALAFENNDRLKVEDKKLKRTGANKESITTEQLDDEIDKLSEELDTESFHVESMDDGTTMLSFDSDHIPDYVSMPKDVAIDLASLMQHVGEQDLADFFVNTTVQLSEKDDDDDNGEQLELEPEPESADVAATDAGIFAGFSCA